MTSFWIIEKIKQLEASDDGISHPSFETDALKLGGGAQKLVEQLKTGLERINALGDKQYNLPRIYEFLTTWNPLFDAQLATMTNEQFASTVSNLPELQQFLQTVFELNAEAIAVVEWHQANPESAQEANSRLDNIQETFGKRLVACADELLAKAEDSGNLREQVAAHVMIGGSLRSMQPGDVKYPNEISLRAREEFEFAVDLARKLKDDSCTALILMLKANEAEATDDHRGALIDLSRAWKLIGSDTANPCCRMIREHVMKMAFVALPFHQHEPAACCSSASLPRLCIRAALYVGSEARLARFLWFRCGGLRAQDTPS